jgi:hypothetical protein
MALPMLRRGGLTHIASTARAVEASKQNTFFDTNQRFTLPDARAAMRPAV